MALSDNIPPDPNHRFILGACVVFTLGFFVSLTKFVYDAGEKPIFWRLAVASGAMGACVGLCVYSLVGIRGDSLTNSVIIFVGTFSGICVKELLVRIKSLGNKWLGVGDSIKKDQ